MKSKMITLALLLSLGVMAQPPKAGGKQGTSSKPVVNPPALKQDSVSIKGNNFTDTIAVTFLIKHEADQPWVGYEEGFMIRDLFLPQGGQPLQKGVRFTDKKYAALKSKPFYYITNQ